MSNPYHSGPILQWEMLDDSSAQAFLPEDPGFPLFLFEWQQGEPGSFGAKGLLTGFFGTDVEDIAETSAFQVAETLLADWCQKHALRILSAGKNTEAVA